MMSFQRHGMVFFALISVSASFCPSSCTRNECFVNCSGVPIQEIEVNEFEKLQKIQINLNLTNCQIKTFPKWIQNLTIKSLDLSNNNIQSIEKDDIAVVNALERLDLSSNQLAGVIRLQSGTLKELNMTHNAIEHIKFDCPQLNSLDMSNNLIKNASESMLPDNLRVLLMSNNR